MNWKIIAKFLMALLTAVGSTTVAALLTEPFSVTTAVTAAVSILTAASIYVFPNGEYGWQKYTKSIVAVLGAVGTPFIVALITGSVTTDSIFVALTAALGALGVYNTPNKED